MSDCRSCSPQAQYFLPMHNFLHVSCAASPKVVHRHYEYIQKRQTELAGALVLTLGDCNATSSLRS